MSSGSIHVSVAGWEDRFLHSTKELITREKPSTLILFRYVGYESWISENRIKVEALCGERSIRLLEESLEYEKPISSWKKIQNVLGNREFAGSKALVNLTTMPREAIWMTLRALQDNASEVDYIYYYPKKYSDSWLTKDHGPPRLLPQQSGYAMFGVPTVLLISVGYDAQRANRLVHFFEPERVLLGIYTGSPLSKSGHVREELSRFTSSWSAENEVFELDASSSDHGFSELLKQARRFTNDSNVLLTSLGPKLSAVALYRLHRCFPQMGLVYVPSKRYNKDYSSGVGDSTRGVLREVNENRDG